MPPILPTTQTLAQISPRARAFFIHRAHVYVVTRSVDATGKPQADQYNRKYQSVPCLYKYTGNVDDPTGVGRIKRPSAFTRDRITFDASLSIPNTALIVNVTPGSPLFGQVHKVEGVGQVVIGHPLRRISQQTFEAMVEDKPPAEVTP